MSWLSDRWGHGGVFGTAGRAVSRNRNAIGQGLKYLAPVVGAFTGGLGGLALGGLGSALGEGVKEGSNFGDIVGAGGIGALGAGAGEGALNAFQGSAGKSLASRVASSLGGAAKGALGGAGGPSGGTLPAGADVSNIANAGMTGVRAPSLTGGASRLSSAASWAGKNALPLGQAAQGAMNARATGAQAAAQNRQQDFTEREYEDEQERRRKVAQYLAPLLQQLTGGMGNFQFAPSSMSGMGR